MAPSCRFFFLVFSTAVFLSVTGCGASAPGLPEGETGTVTGSATFNGNPIPPGSSVMMLHDKTGQIAMGTVMEDGSFTLMMKGGSDILAGKYKIGVTPPGDPNESSSSMPAANASEEQLKDAYLAAGEKKIVAEKWPEIPKRWRQAETSGETFIVKPNEENNLPLELK